MSPAAANKEIIGLVVTDGNKYRIILFEPTAGKAILEGDIEQLKPEDKDISFINWSALYGFPPLRRTVSLHLNNYDNFFPSV